ncbi:MULTISPECIES: DNA replication/repair protein RecF [Enterococcus]|uniref:DNA replication and repair protein RecF n=1 Tax=Enterococcus malodoratus ATCC 43197 TaxID=1158601 RepID=R2QUM7_9ENTE|nr:MULTISPECIES: DNA replication/repair protein RecF [Enterococcus]BBM20008.1 DNA replication and repair protein RecF [Enterococcus avium]EOH72201.1 DNA replication and repair protein recF [Enterococcus malodoratus ATCC 43197]EOT70474.1 DNA replication and repair protein recF [Enterococcus malodoratus ATCC 43197]SET22021.1 DNA replication and repair protein RecF [Enterococcus malodoratus]SPW69524.1 recombination protein F, RecF [Enterococcus malodoratus]
MRLNRLELRNYRNYQDLILKFPNRLNIFLGENAQGKTNLLESIYVLALTRSHRTSSEQELIGWQDDFAQIKGRIDRGTSELELELLLTKKGRKSKINHIEQKKLSSYIGQLNVILFAPEDLSLVKGSPQIRRRFIDMELGQINPVYLYDLAQYQQTLKQRNLYLKQLSEKKQTDEIYLDILTEQLADFGSKVLANRLKFVKKLEFWSNDLHRKITNQKEELEIKYEASIPLESEDIEDIRIIFLNELKKNRKREIFKGNTFLGPHRDDLIFQVNQQNVQTYGSQGQQRTTALSVKLAEIDLMKEETGEYPILLLDDVMSELDDNRQIHLLETIENKVQTFLTTTTLNHVKGKMTVHPDIFYVHQGQIERTETE